MSVARIKRWPAISTGRNWPVSISHWMSSVVSRDNSLAVSEIEYAFFLAFDICTSVCDRKLPEIVGSGPRV
jgi:hypothetical protein